MGKKNLLDFYLLSHQSPRLSLQGRQLFGRRGIPRRIRAGPNSNSLIFQGTMTGPPLRPTRRRDRPTCNRKDEQR